MTATLPRLVPSGGGGGGERDGPRGSRGFCYVLQRMPK